MGAIVRQIDHVLIRTDDVRGGFSLLTETLQLPVAWPLFPYLGFLSGAASVGNVNLELLQPVGEVNETARAPGTRLLGVAFEPPGVDESVRELDGRRIAHARPWTFRLNDQVSWESVDISGWPDCPIMLLVKYKRDQDAQRARFAASLAERDGGPLGATGFERLVVGARDAESARVRWRRLLEPAVETEPGRWSLAGDMELVVEPGDADGLASITVKVRSLERAAAAMRERGLLGASGDGWVGLRLGDAGAVVRLSEGEVPPTD